MVLINANYVTLIALTSQCKHSNNHKMNHEGKNL